MNEALVILGAILGCLISCVTVARFLFYTKAEVDSHLKTAKQDSDDRDDVIKKELAETKETIYEKLLDAERESIKSRQDLYEKLSQNKDAYEHYNKKILEMMADVRQEQNENNTSFTQVLASLKDELKNDYIARYNELLKMIGTKTNSSDFDRLENKFDKVTETITELKTIVTMQLEENNKRK